MDELNAIPKMGVVTTVFRDGELLWLDLTELTEPELRHIWVLAKKTTPHLTTLHEAIELQLERLSQHRLTA